RPGPRPQILADALRQGAVVLDLRKLIRRCGGLLGNRSSSSTPSAAPEPKTVDVRIESDLFAVVREHVEDFSRGEETGFLLCAVSALSDGFFLLAREWLPVPKSEIERNAHGSVLSWS